jgi:hypothetical protein
MKTVSIEVTIEEGESVMRGWCSVCGWIFDQVYEVGDDERGDSQDKLTLRHELNINCIHPLTFTERAS